MGDGVPKEEQEKRNKFVLKLMEEIGKKPHLIGSLDGPLMVFWDTDRECSKISEEFEKATGDAKNISNSDMAIQDAKLRGAIAKLDAVRRAVIEEINDIIAEH